MISSNEIIEQIETQAGGDTDILCHLAREIIRNISCSASNKVYDVEGGSAHWQQWIQINSMINIMRKQQENNQTIRKLVAEPEVRAI